MPRSRDWHFCANNNSNDDDFNPLPMESDYSMHNAYMHVLSAHRHVL